MNRGKKRILVIEPDKVFGETVLKSLSLLNHEVVLTNSAQAAIGEADRQTPDLVILELMLVSHSGIEFLYEFRSYLEWQDVPVIIFSSVPMIEFSASKQGLINEIGVSLYLYKPNTSLRTLNRSVSQLLNQALINESV